MPSFQLIAPRSVEDLGAFSLRQIKEGKMSVEHVISAEQYSRQQIEEVCDRADMFRQVYDANDGPSPLTEQYRNWSCVTLFGESSTRTHLSSANAAGLLGMSVVHMAAAESAMLKGESPKATAITLGAVGARLLVVRMPIEGMAAELAAYSNIPVVNAGDGANEHPTQMFLDIDTARRRLGDLTGSRWVMFGDVGHSRTLNSLVIALSKFGAHATLVAPEGMGPSERTLHYLEKHQLSYDIQSNLDEAVVDANVLYGIRSQKERHGTKKIGPPIILDQQVLSRVRDDAIVMHPGPHGVEIADEVYNDPRAVFAEEQPRNGLHIRTALFDRLLGSRAFNAIMESEFAQQTVDELVPVA
jgi:aspartate carbamoyltransferase catalytic subunit